MKVRTVDILNPFSLATFSGGKDAVLDIRARDESGRDLQVEIQLRQLEAANHRMTDNICRLYADQIKKGGEYRDHRPVVAVWIFNEPLFPEGRWIDSIRMVRDSSNSVFDDHLAIVILELSMWNRLAQEEEMLPSQVLQENSQGLTFTEESLADLTRWMRFLASGEELDPEELPEWARQDSMREAVEIMGAFTKEEEERDLYWRQIEAERLANSMRGDAIRKGMAEGLSQGLAQGIAQGIVQGRGEGEAAAQRTIALKMKQLGISVDMIIEVTGISAEELG